ncbi:M6 family metalloprotease domain-containing protein [Streptomyces avermitilis]|uniref:M6 family metalloprotease domain-containing protein n=1 Tax=Streptomyces avermitilis TaxID=33903 RepID=UPI0033AD67DF
MSPTSAGRATARAVWSDFCAVSPSPELRDRLRSDLARIRETNTGLAAHIAPARTPRRPGFDDGTIIPPEEFPAGTPAARIRAAAAERAPLRGTVRVIVVLVDFPDKELTATAQHFRDLFFSENTLQHGSVRDYFKEVTHGLVSISGEVVGPVTLPHTLAWYANNNFGIGRPSGEARANIMARDAAIQADPSINYAPYDNDGNGFVDAFVLVHAGEGGEVTGDPGDLWSHKWTLPRPYPADGAKIYGYLTIPEDAKIGVCAHELGHLLFGFPDLYDIDGTSEGVGDWCLMSGGSWGGGGDIPVHPSAWCKAQQQWVSTQRVTTDGMLALPDVKNGFEVHQLWKRGAPGREYFLLENRQQTGYDRSLPAPGLLVWHVDENQPDNSDENHYMVGLVQADGCRALEQGGNRGDEGDPYPGSTGNTAFTGGSNPSSHSYAGAETGVSITGISAPGEVMTANVSLAPSPAERMTAERMTAERLTAERLTAPAGTGPQAATTPELAGEILEIQARLAAMEQDLASIASKVLTPLVHTGMQSDAPRMAAAHGNGRPMPQ